MQILHVFLDVEFTDILLLPLQRSQYNIVMRRELKEKLKEILEHEATPKDVRFSLLAVCNFSLLAVCNFSLLAICSFLCLGKGTVL